MKIIWLGHSGFRIEIAGQVLLIDPWLTGNPMFPADKRAEALAGATHILISHGHGDHGVHDGHDGHDGQLQCGLPASGCDGTHAALQRSDALGGGAHDLGSQVGVGPQIADHHLHGDAVAGSGVTAAARATFFGDKSHWDSVCIVTLTTRRD